MLINEATRLDPARILWIFDNGGEITSMKKPELVTIAKSRLVQLSAQQCEGMDETDLCKRLASLVCIYFIGTPC